MNDDDKIKDPPAWLLGLGLTFLLGALIGLLFLPANSWGF